MTNKIHIKLSLVFLQLLCIGYYSMAQINYADIYNPHFNTHQSRYFPGMLGTSFKTGTVDFINVYGWAGNNAIGAKYLEDMVFGNKLSDTQIKEMLSKMKGNTNMFFGVDLQAINVAFKVHKKGKGGELFSMQIGHRERIMGNLQVNKNAIDLLMNGNKQFADKTIPLGPLNANAIYFREWNIGASVPINLTAGGHSLKLRPGVTAKFIQGIANIYTERSKLEMYTEPEGRYLEFNADYKINSSLNTKQVGNMLGTGGGMGGGVDLGMDITLDDYLRMDVGLIDVGAVRFTKNVTTYSKTGVSRYEGAEVDLFPESQQKVGLSIDPNLLNLNKSESAYTTPLGAKFTMRLEYRLGKDKLTGKQSDLIYFKHRVFFTYIQGTKTIYNTTTTPNFSLGYMYSYRNILNMGLSMNFLGYNKFGVGPFLSIKGGPFVIGFGSNNLMALVAPKFGTGADAYLNLGFVF